MREVRVFCFDQKNGEVGVLDKGMIVSGGRREMLTLEGGEGGM